MHILSKLAIASAALVSSIKAAPGDDIGSNPYWHERYHGWLSMAAYGDYKTLCPQKFTNADLQKSFPGSTASPWTIIAEYNDTQSGINAFSVIIPEMDKVVLVFGGKSWQSAVADVTQASLEPLIPTCVGCMAHKGALDVYMNFKKLSNNFTRELATQRSTGHQFSVTGHGWGGMLAHIAAIDMGRRGQEHVRWSHSHGAPAVFNRAAAAFYDNLFVGEMSARTTSYNDSVPTSIPLDGETYRLTTEGFWVNGTTYEYSGMCYYWNDQTCLGGNVSDDWYFYYTPIGTCGQEWRPDAALQNRVKARLEAAWIAEGGSVSVTASVPAATSTSVSSSTVESSTSTVSTVESTAIATSSVDTTATASANSADVTGAINNNNNQAGSGAGTLKVSGLVMSIALIALLA